MFQKLKERWGVNYINLFLIIATFAIGGSLCSYLSKKILSLLNINKGLIWILLYLIIITFLWPIAVLLISIFLGQFTFFKNYITKVFARFYKVKNDAIKNSTINIAIFASGQGSNANKIIDYFSTHATIKIVLIVCNNEHAGVLNIAAKNNITTLLINKNQFLNGDYYLPQLKNYAIDFVVLAGFLLKIPLPIIQQYPKKIINIHPALLPKYGGKGMYGHFVHQAIIDNKEAESGITIHFVDEIYDHGEIIFQEKCIVLTTDTAETLANKIHLLEHKYYPSVLEKIFIK